MNRRKLIAGFLRVSILVQPIITNHADSETLTQEDTDIMKEIYNNKWSWDRRAIIVEVGNLKLPASMAGMPHDSAFIKDNGMDGHMKKKLWPTKKPPSIQHLFGGFSFLVEIIELRFGNVHR